MLEGQGDGLPVAQVDDRQRVLDFQYEAGLEAGNRAVGLENVEPVGRVHLVGQVDVCFRAAITVTLIVFLQPPRNGEVSCRLQAAVDGREDFVASGVGVHAQHFESLRTGHFGHVGGRDIGDGAVVISAVRLADGRLETRTIDIAELQHAAEHVVAPLHRPLR
jgi:hypothetical protein